MIVRRETIPLGVSLFNGLMQRFEGVGVQFDEEQATIQACKLIGKQKVPLKL